VRGFPARRRVTATAHTTDRHRRKKSRLHRTSHTDLEGADAEPVTRAPHTPLRAFPVRKNTQTLAGESSAISLLPHRIPFPRRAHRELPGLRRAETGLTSPSSMPARSPPTLVLADASIDGSVLGSARRTRRRTTPLHDQSRPGRTHCLRGVSSPLRPLTPGRLPGGPAANHEGYRHNHHRDGRARRAPPFPAMRASPKCFPQRT